MADYKETAVGYLNCDSYATFSSSEDKWIRKIRELEYEHPNEVTIIHNPLDNNGMLVARIPKSWLKIKAPFKRNITEEQRAAMSERLAGARAKRSG